MASTQLEIGLRCGVSDTHREVLKPLTLVGGFSIIYLHILIIKKYNICMKGGENVKEWIEVIGLILAVLL